MSDATGGTITYSGGDTIHTFTSSGNFVCGTGTLKVLVVAGGGAGTGQQGGGGGGGGLVYHSAMSIEAGTFTVTTGAGGNQTYGGNSVFNGITALGGGKGQGEGGTDRSDSDGGSGGGVGREITSGDGGAALAACPTALPAEAL